MSNANALRNIGLRGVTVADTGISQVDGVHGKILIRGFSIQDLATMASYEETAYILLYECAPNLQEFHEFMGKLDQHRSLTDYELQILRSLPHETTTMQVLQGMVALLAGDDLKSVEETKDALCEQAIRIMAKMPSIVAAWARIKNNQDIVPPKPGLGHAGNFLYMLKGTIPDPETIRDFDVCLMLHTEHSFNASTFTGRVVTSTRANVYAAISAAIGSLSGNLHGGANKQVMNNLLEIEAPENAAKWVLEQFEQGNRIMGMGHAVYKTTDPRAEILRTMSKRLGTQIGDTRWYDITHIIQETTQEIFKARKGREIFPNVDLYSASVYYMMGINPDLFPAIFALSRVAGWTAHIIEERYPSAPIKATLYRPSSEYRGKYCGPLGCVFEPLKK